MKKILYGIAMFLLIIGFWKLFDDCTMDRQEKPNMQVFRITDSVFQNYGIYDSECSIEGCYFYGEEYLSEDVAHELLTDRFRLSDEDYKKWRGFRFYTLTEYS